VNIVDYNSLNEKQQIIFKRIKSHYHDMLTRSQTGPLRIIVMGTVGTGKSYLIMAIRNMLREMTGNEAKNPLLRSCSLQY
jgi:DNA replication protein DnaC